MINGYGRFIHVNGDEYVGDLVNNVPHGQGVFYGNDGSKYDGEWVNGLK